jgi:hypothetical protein
LKYLAVVFMAPVFFLMRGKYGPAFINAFFYGMACLFAITIIFAVVAPLFWMISVMHGMWYLRKEMVAEDAEVLATKMAEKMGHWPQPQVQAAAAGAAMTSPVSIAGPACRHCGAPRKVEARFCESCGTGIEATA